MTQTSRATSSAYMHWVKTQTKVAFSLAISGIKNYPLSELPVDFASLELSGPGAYGYPPLVEAIAQKCGVPKECVATAQGTSMANYLAMSAIVEPGDQVLIECPGYPLLWETASYVGAEVKFFSRNHRNGFSIDLDEICRKVNSRTRLIVVTNLHNPSCALLDQQVLLDLGQIAQSIGAHVLVDEVYLDLLFDKTPETAAKLGPEFVVTSSLTKVYGLSGLRCGWILAQPDLIRKIYSINDLLGVNNAYVTDQLSCIALQHLPKIAAWSRELLDRNRAVAEEFIGSTPEMYCDQPLIGTVLFPSLDISVAKLCRVLRDEYDTIITPGEFFGALDRVRIGIGGDTGTLIAGLARVHKAVKAIHRS